MGLNSCCLSSISLGGGAERRGSWWTSADYWAAQLGSLVPRRSSAASNEELLNACLALSASVGVAYLQRQRPHHKLCFYDFISIQTWF